MKIQVQVSELMEATKKVMAVVPSKTTLPILGHIHISAGGSGTVIAGTDLESRIEISVSSKVEERGMVCVNAKKLWGVLKRLEKVGDVTLLTEENKLHIQQGKIVYKVDWSDPADYPMLPVGSASLVGQTDMFVEGIRNVLFAVSRDRLRSLMNHTMVGSKDNHLVFACTDGYRLAEWRVASDCELPKYFISGEVCDIVVKVFDGSEPMSIGELVGGESQCPKHLILRQGGITLITRLEDGRYPNYGGLFDFRVTGIVGINTEFRTAIERASNFGFEGRCGLVVENGVLLVRSGDADTNVLEETVDTEFEGEFSGICFNAKMLCEAFKNRGLDKVTLNFGGDDSMFGFSEDEPSRDGKSFRYIQMPFRK